MNSQVIKVSPLLSGITLNVNEISSSIKRQRWEERLKIHTPIRCCLQGTHFRTTYPNIWKVKRCEKVFHENNNQKSAGQL